MAEAYQRHDISDAAWALLEPRLLGRKGVWGGIAHDNRRFINAVLDFENGCAMAGFAALVWGLEEHTPKVLPLA